MEEYRYTSTQPLGHTGPVEGTLYLYLYLRNDVHGIDKHVLYNNISFAQNVRKKVKKKRQGSCKLEFSPQILQKRPLKLNENPSSGLRVFHVDRQTDVINLVVACRCSVSGP
jgi:hypothetical protein